jgi:hypothetical protein
VPHDQDSPQGRADTLRELQEELSKLSQLRSTAGYDLLVGVLHSQADTRKQSIFLTPLKSLDEVPEQEYKKGEIAGIEFAAKFVDIQIEILRQSIATYTREVESDENSEISIEGINSGHGRLNLEPDSDDSTEFDVE